MFPLVAKLLFVSISAWLFRFHNSCTFSLPVPGNLQCMDNSFWLGGSGFCCSALELARKESTLEKNILVGHYLSQARV
jgi:hypothetical protein